MLGSSGVARISRAAARFAGVGSAPSPSAKLNVAKQKNSKRQADISGNLAKVKACVSGRGRQLRKVRLPPLHESDKPAADFICGRKQGAFSLSAISVVVR